MTYPYRILIILIGLLFTVGNGDICLAQEPESTEFDDTEDIISYNRRAFTDLSQGEWEVPKWSLKTNLLTWVLTVPNLTGEVRVSDHFALDLGLWWCPWKASDRYSLKVFAILPEGRYWFSRHAFGHYLNIHLTGAWFNLRFKDDRYQDTDRPLLGAGLGYGYQFQFNENWGLDLNIGVGYLNMEYDTYYNIENGAIRDTRRTSYFGIDRLGVSLVYRFTP